MSLKQVHVAELFHRFADIIDRPEVRDKLHEQDPGGKGLAQLTQALCWFAEHKAGVNLVKASRPVPVNGRK